MSRWFEHQIVDTGRVPLLFFLLGFIGGFVFIRFSVRMIRAQVRWWPGNVTPGGQHVHHVVFGVVMMLVSGVALIAIYEDGTQTSGAVLAALFGVGAALVLDEFALIFYLKDVYWSQQGRASVDAVFAAVAVTGLLLLGARPDAIVNPTDFRDNPNPWVRLALVVSALISLAVAGVVIAKGKIWTALFGMFVSPLLLVGAIRLSRPGAPWARWRYQDKPKKMARAVVREKRYRRPLIRAKIFLQDLIAGTPSVEHAMTATEAELERTVRPAPAPVSRG
ncbi:hypothetical protein [Rhodococcus gannanensis]|uniref:Integral membrane protein n=1 Tax=Rhodococcus gannanensis TaxID=1960308 RepID=A0ABW4PA75_9NOCA